MIRVCCLLYEGFALMDVAGPLTAFEAATALGASGYALDLAAAAEGPVPSSGGSSLQARDVLKDASCDTLLVPGGIGARHPSRYRALLPVIRDAAASGRRVVSVCSGAFLLAEAGVLSGRTVATHWAEAPELARRYPSLRVDPDSLFVRDGNFWTSAGISAGIDLALALIEHDYGTELARRVAQMMVVPLRRPGNQSQHSALLELIGPDHRFNEVLAWAREHLAEPLDVARLADRAALGARQFSRAFEAAVGMSPAKAIERLRLEVARSEIESGRGSFDRIAQTTGFGTPGRMRRAFLRVFGETPRVLRRDVHARARTRKPR